MIKKYVYAFSFLIFSGFYKRCSFVNFFEFLLLFDNTQRNENFQES